MKSRMETDVNTKLGAVFTVGFFFLGLEMALP